MKNFICAILSLMLFVACSEEITDSSVQIGGDESVTPSITLNQTSINFDEHADTQEITFNSAMAWTAELINERADGWCSISPTSGSAGSGRINVNVTNNSTTDDRTASVIIKSGAISRTVRITQKQQDALTVTASSFEVEGTRGKIYIEVKANIDFEYTINGTATEWITPIETRAMKTTTLGFNIAENKTMQRREGTITIHSGSFSETVTVYQKDGGEAILLSQSEYVVSDAGEDIAVEVTSNVDVEIEMPDVDWITRNVSRAVSTNTYYFTVAENTTYDQREAYITFKNTEKNITERVKVTQVQRDAIVLAKSEYEMEQDGGALDFDIQTNVEVSVTISEDAQSWITQVQTRGLETRTLFFDISAYEGDDMREGTITISGGGATQTVTVRQLSWQNLEDNKIFYTSSDGSVIEPNEDAYWGERTTIISNTYENGQGVIVFSRNLTEVGSDAFQECDALTSITIPNSVKRIGDCAFSGCYKLADVSLNEGLEYIGESAFFRCDVLESIAIPNSVKTIGGGAFNQCFKLKTATLGSGLETIEYNLFICCSSLEEIIVPDNIKAINHSAFEQCGNLKRIIFGSNLETIGDNAFLYCGKLESITIPDSVTSIGSGAFQDCYTLASVTFGSGLETIGDSAFAVCNSLTNITIPDNVKRLGNNAFNSCEKLAEVNLGNGLEFISSNVFGGCKALTSITIPNSVKTIDGSAFSGCSNLAEVTIGESVETIGWAAFLECKALTSITIPNSVKTIDGHAFSNCSNLAEINIGTGVETIGEWAFQGCGSLTSINIPGNVKTINNNAFGSCSNLAEVTLNEGLETIGSNAFGWCYALKSITIPQSVVEITGNPVAYSYGIEAFYGKFASEDNSTLIVNNEIVAIANYESLTSYTIPNGITKIADYAFANWWNLQSITIPDSVTEIGNSAFESCGNLQTINIPESVTSIGADAFLGCGNLQTINIPEGITTIKSNTFGSCSNLKEITLPNSLTKIGDWAFQWSGLTEITIPDNVTEIGDGAFTACNNLTSFSGKFASEDNKSLVIDNRLIAYAYSGSTEYIIPEGVTTLGSYSFAWIMEQPMATISLPNSLTTIEGGAFYDCRTISEITIPENITYIGGFSMEKLSKIYCKATTPPTLGGNPFNGSQTSTHTIYVPTTSVNAYKNADGWRDYAHLIQGYDF